MDAALLGQLLAAGLFLLIILFLLAGYLVAFTLGGVAILVGFLGVWAGAFDPALFAALPNRFWGVLTNPVLIAVPLFVFMGVVLERSGIAESLLTTMGQVFGTLRGGLALSVVLVGALLAAATGVVGATVVTMGLLSLPAMMRAGYDPRLACGTICAAGTLGQIIPPSTVLIFMADIMQGANSAAQLALGNFAPDTVSVGDLFAGAILPSLLLTGLYALYVMWRAIVAPETCPPVSMTREERAGLLSRVVSALIPPVTLIVAVLGSIIAGVATPTESASVGAVGALFLAAIRVLADGRLAPPDNPARDRRLLAFWLGFLAAVAAVATLFGGAGLLTYMVVVLGLALLLILVQPGLLRVYAAVVFRSCVTTMSITSMVFVILLGATAFALVFTQMGGSAMVRQFLEGLPGGQTGALVTVFFIIFVLGFFLDTFEILFIVVPITAPVLLIMGVEPIWLGVMIGVLLQTSFLTPPFGFSLFYLRGVAPASIRTAEIYRGAVPFIGLQIVALAILWTFPDLATWLPNEIFRSGAPGRQGPSRPPPSMPAVARKTSSCRPMRDLPTLKQLEYFVALVEAGSFRAAAERCGISQPSLSVQLAELERRLGQTLVERHRSGVILTAAGREAHERATAILDGTRHLVARLAARGDGMTGTVRLGASPTLGPYLLPPAIARLRTEHPDLKLLIREAPPEVLAAGLTRGEYDMALLQLPVRGELATQRLFREPLELVVAADHPLAVRGRASRADLAGETVLSLGPTFGLRQQIADLCAALGARLRDDYEGTSLDALRQMAGMGMGVAFLPALYVRVAIGADARDVSVVPLEGQRLLRSVGLVNRGSAPSEPAARLARVLQAVVREVFPGLLFLEPL